jgi:hypothetical protein
MLLPVNKALESYLTTLDKKYANLLDKLSAKKDTKRSTDAKR